MQLKIHYLTFYCLFFFLLFLSTTIAYGNKWPIIVESEDEVHSMMLMDENKFFMQQIQFHPTTVAEMEKNLDGLNAMEMGYLASYYFKNSQIEEGCLYTIISGVKFHLISTYKNQLLKKFGSDQLDQFPMGFVLSSAMAGYRAMGIKNVGFDKYLTACSLSIEKVKKQSGDWNTDALLFTWIYADLKELLETYKDLTNNKNISKSERQVCINKSKLDQALLTNTLTSTKGNIDAILNRIYMGLRMDPFN